MLSYLTEADGLHSEWIEECCFNIPSYVWWNVNYSCFAVSLFRWYPQSDGLVYPACDHHHWWDADEQHHSPPGEHVTRTLPVPAPLPLCRRCGGSAINHQWGCFHLQRPERHGCHRPHPQCHLLSFASRRSARSLLPVRGTPGANLPEPNSTAANLQPERPSIRRQHLPAGALRELYEMRFCVEVRQLSAFHSFGNGTLQADPSH